MRIKKWFFLFLLFPFVCNARTYHNIGIEDGLSSRNVYCIQKDNTGFMWFLTSEGIDKFDGKNFKRYELLNGDKKLTSFLNLDWLYIDPEGVLWEIGKDGNVFGFDQQHDRFQLAYQIPSNHFQDLPTPVSYSWMDRDNNIWLCNEDSIYLYNTKQKSVVKVKNTAYETINIIEQVDSKHFFIGTEQSLLSVNLNKTNLDVKSDQVLDRVDAQINDLYYDPKTSKLFIATSQKGLLIYDTKAGNEIVSIPNVKNIGISRIRPLNDKELLVATEKGEIYKINMATQQSILYIPANYNHSNGINANYINDIYVDEKDRIWLANYPIGITVESNRYLNYQRYRHLPGNSQSLVNDQVNVIIEDREGDLWFGTNNGVSTLSSRTNKWQSYFDVFKTTQNSRDRIFTSLAEVSPGIIWAGGYFPGVYQINKANTFIDYFIPETAKADNQRIDKYILDIKKDSQGDIWLGGYDNLIRCNWETKEKRLYPAIKYTTSLLEKDKDHMWVGTTSGLYLLEKESGKFEQIKFNTPSVFINYLCQIPDGSLFIGTKGAGLYVYYPASKKLINYQVDNSPLLSNNIYTIVSSNDNYLIISSESGLSYYNPKKMSFLSWTKDLGILPANYFILAGILRDNNDYVFGSINGAVELSKDAKTQDNYSSKMIFSDFKLLYQTVYPGDDDSPLTTDINDTKKLKLAHDQNTFSLVISSLNYDYPDDVLYSWKMEGLYDDWSKPTTENMIRYINLSPGKYKLIVRAVSDEDQQVVLEEKSIDIVVSYPFWLGPFATIIYILLAIAIVLFILRVYLMKKQRDISDEKIRFFINTAHDIRTPLTLIKAPLEDISDKESLSNEGIGNMNTAMRNVNALIHLTSNLINFERADVYSSDLYISEHELNSFMTEIIDVYKSFAIDKSVKFSYESNFEYLEVWFDTDKMESIMKNAISNALKYTPEGGSVQVMASNNGDTWSVEVKDTGIGIPLDEQSKLFKLHFRGSNAVNSKVTGSGICLMLIWKLIRLHKGKISLSSVENQGTDVKMTFPISKKLFRKAHFAPPTRMKPQIIGNLPAFNNLFAKENVKHIVKNSEGELSRILIVEDNDELRSYLAQTLSEEYIVQGCVNGKEAINIMAEYRPDLVISDIMMPVMDGEELCREIKNNIETSHIPVILLTALSNEKDVMSGLNTGADEYIVKPFNIGILKATISGLLANRARLRKKYSQLDADVTKDDLSGANNIDLTQDIDWKFITSVRKCIEENLKDTTLTVDTLCSMLKMSRTSLYNKLKALTDQTPSDYIRLVRLNQAEKLLKDGKYGVAEVAEMTGLGEPKYFREIFKKHFGVSPSQYAKSSKEEEETT